jgi:hypothetical protein
LEGVTWRTPKSTTEIRHQHMALLHSKELPGILRKWHKPPWSSAGMRRPAGAKCREGRQLGADNRGRWEQQRRAEGLSKQSNQIR